LAAEDVIRARDLHRLTLGPGACANWWGPDYRKITDILVRKAIGYAYPYKAAEAAVGRVFGVTELPGSTILPPYFPGHQDYTVLDIAPGRTDPDKAKALLKRAGYAPGEYVLKWPYVTTDPGWAAQTRVMVDALDAAGFKAKPYPTPSIPAFNAMQGDPEAPINLHPAGWCPEFPTGGNWFLAFQSGNLSFFSEPAVDAEIERILRLPLDQQDPAWVALDKTIMTTYYPVIITGYHVTALLHGSKIGGINVDNTIEMPTWKDLYVIP
jgi:peptide/nickel transport system substrate-binding protein